LRAGIRLSLRQRLLYGLVEFYYPSVAAMLVLGSAATAIYLLLGITAMQVNAAVWVLLWTASMVSWVLLWFWLRRFNLAEHERRELGLLGMLLALFAGPIYVAAAARALAGRPLRYAVTAKGSLKSADSMRTFRLHLFWAAAAAALLLISFQAHHDVAALRIWGSLAVIIGIGPPVILAASRLGDDARLPADQAGMPRAPGWVPIDVKLPVPVPAHGAAGRVTGHDAGGGPAVPDRLAHAFADRGGPWLTGGPSAAVLPGPYPRDHHPWAAPSPAPMSGRRPHSAPQSWGPDISRGAVPHSHRDFPAGS
jgi:cellulose synthase (UDP-forming)